MEYNHLQGGSPITLNLKLHRFMYHHGVGMHSSFSVESLWTKFIWQILENWIISSVIGYNFKWFKWKCRTWHDWKRIHITSHLISVQVSANKLCNVYFWQLWKLRTWYLLHLCTIPKTNATNILIQQLDPIFSIPNSWASRLVKSEQIQLVGGWSNPFDKYYPPGN